MNRFLEKLLAGAKVEWLPLGETAKIIHGKDWKKLNKGEIPVYGSGGIMGYVDQYAYDKPTVLIPRKGSITNIFYIDSPFWNVDTIFYLKIDDLVIPKFLYYFISTIDMMALDTGSGRPSLTKEIIQKILVPLPCPGDPLNSKRIQTEIVRILDAFSQLISQLISEYNKRKLQYQYYLEELFKFKNMDVEWNELRNIAVIGTGCRNTNEQLDNGKFPFFVRSQEPRTLDSYDFDETAIITAGDGVGVGKVFHFISGKYALHQRAYRIVPDSNIIMPKFLFYFMKFNFFNYITLNSVQSSVASLRKPMFEKYKIPLPSLAEQTRIVSILDKFDRLTNSLREGLPREIESRKKQYAYYRDLLFDFPHASSDKE